MEITLQQKKLLKFLAGGLLKLTKKFNLLKVFVSVISTLYISQAKK